MEILTWILILILIYSITKKRKYKYFNFKITHLLFLIFIGILVSLAIKCVLDIRHMATWLGGIYILFMLNISYIVVAVINRMETYKTVTILCGKTVVALGLLTFCFYNLISGNIGIVLGGGRIAPWSYLQISSAIVVGSFFLAIWL